MLNKQEEEYFKKAYDEAWHHCEYRKENDKTFTIETLVALLHNLYIREDNNEEGRGTFKAAELEASIAAYQSFLYEWKKG